MAVVQCKYARKVIIHRENVRMLNIRLFSPNLYPKSETCFVLLGPVMPPLWSSEWQNSLNEAAKVKSK